MFVVTILLIACLDMVNLDQNKYDVLEFYAGAQRLAKLAQGLGETSMAMDIMYDTFGDNKSTNNCMDINTCGGFTPLIQN